MELKFEYGDSQRPRGHALVYFTSGEKVAVAYMMVLPIDLDMERYVPPFIADQLKSFGAAESPSIFALPPIPEPMESLEQVLTLATNRDDDLLYGGDYDVLNATESMEKVNAISRAYYEICVSYGITAASFATDEEIDNAIGEVDDDTVPSLQPGLSEATVEEKLRRLTDVLGQLRYAVESNNQSHITERKQDILNLAKTMPETMKIGQLVKHATSSSEVSAELTQLYLERAYQMQKENYLKVKELEEKIALVDDQNST